MDLTDSLKNYAESKVAGLAKYLNAQDAHIELERLKKHKSGMVFRAEIKITAGKKVMWADTAAEDIYSAVDLVIPKLKEQMTKFKDKRATLQKRGARSAKMRR